MNTGMGIVQIAPIYSSSFLSQSYNPKAEVPISTTKKVGEQSPFFEVLSALVTADNHILKQKTKKRH